MVVSAQPVAPSLGTVLAIGCFSDWRRLTWNGHERGGDEALVLEVVHLDEGVVPVAADDLPLAAQQLERRLVLVLVQLIGVLDAEFGLVGLEVERGVGDVDRPVEGLDAARIGLAVGQVHRLEDDVPACRGLP